MLATIRLTFTADPSTSGSALAGMAGHEAVVHRVMRRLRPVMEGAEPAVERDRAVMVVALEVFVMEVVGIAVRCDRRLLADDDPLEPGMAVRRRQSGMKQLEQCVDR